MPEESYIIGSARNDTVSIELTLTPAPVHVKIVTFGPFNSTAVTSAPLNCTTNASAPFNC